MESLGVGRNAENKYESKETEMKTPLFIINSPFFFEKI